MKSKLDGGSFSKGAAYAAVGKVLSYGIDAPPGIQKGLTVAFSAGITAELFGGDFGDAALIAYVGYWANEYSEKKEGAVQKAMNSGSAAAAPGLVLAKNAGLLASRVAAGITTGLTSMAEDLNLINSLADSKVFLKAEFGIDLTQSTLNNADATIKLFSGGVGMISGGVLVGAGGASISAVGTGTATVFLSSYSLTRGIDVYTGGRITRAVADGMCHFSGNC